MKFRRSERLIDMTDYLKRHPHQLTTLSFFTKRYDAAKSSVSEDIVILKRTFRHQGIGLIETVPGATGGVRFIPMLSSQKANEIGDVLVERINSPKRILTGGFMYLTDLLVHPLTLDFIGRIIASKFALKDINAVMTVATKGVPLAQSVARYLNVPFVIARREAKVTEGATISINYPSYRTNRIEKMLVSKKSLNEGDRVLIVDDFSNGGGTIEGMTMLADEFGATIVGSVVLCELNAQEKKMRPFESIAKITKLDEMNKEIQVEKGSFFNDLSMLLDHVKEEG
ncbi:pur operon repressor [Atopobacter phocae]|uniref:pur operon repressor n=1 Tax=Atopobacter phocae TaxID=136492 RepID=UPI00046EDAEC|nr:pur operon repressor [Atopobacter phocae]